MQITATLHPPRAGVTIYFDLEDPPDTSPYGTPAQNDNLGGPGGLSLASGVSDADGHVTTVLTITDRYAGDNYRVRARLTAGGPLIARTGIITAWKRIFVEQDKMFRQPGQDLTSDAPAAATTLDVSDSSRFVVGDAVLIFDADNQDPESNSVAATTPTTITLTAPIARSYTVVAGAYIGRPADGFFEPDVTALSRTFDQAFVEVLFEADGSNPLPHRSAAQLDGDAGLIPFSALWFRNGRTLRNGTNYIHVIGCDRLLLPGAVGYTLAEHNFTYVCRGLIEDNHDPLLVPPVVQDVSAHELAHQFGLSDEMHLGHPAWCNPAYCGSALCLMEMDENLEDGIDELEVQDLLTGTPAVRREADPI